MASGKGDRTTKLTLQAENLTGKPFSEVSAAIDKLTQKLAEQSAGAAKGEVTTRELNNTLTKLAQAQAALAQQNSAVQNFKNLSAALQEAQNKAAATGTALQALVGKAGSAEAKTTAYARSVRQATSANTAAEKSLARVQSRFDAAAESMQRTGLASKTYEESLAILAAENGRLNQSYVAGAATLENYDQLQRTLRANNKAAADEAREKAAQVKAAAEAEEKASAEAAAAEQRNAKLFSATIEQRIAAASKESQARATFAAKLSAGLAKAENDRERAAAKAAQDQAESIARFNQNLAAYREEREARITLNKEIAESIAIRKKEAEESRASAKAIAEAIAQQAKNTKNPAAKPLQEDAGGGGIGGLNQYQLQLIGYRIKDIVDQLGAGSSVFRVFAQQGAATADIFQNNLIPSLVAFLPEIALVAGAVTIAGAALYRTIEGDASIRKFAAQLTLSADASKYNTAQLLAEQRQLERLGAGFDEAGTALRTFVQAGIKPDQVERFGAASENLAKVLGGSLPDAAKEVTKAFTGDFKAVAELDDKLNFLTATQRASIKALFDSGQAARGSATAFGIFTDKISAARDVAEGPVAKAFLDLRNSVHSFLDAIGSNQILTAFLKDLRDIVGAADQFVLALDKIRGGTGQQPGSAADNKAKRQGDKDQIADLQKQLSDLQSAQSSGDPRVQGPQTRQDTRGAQMAALSAKIKELKADELGLLAATVPTTGAIADQGKATEGLTIATQSSTAKGKEYLDYQKLRFEAEVKNNTSAKLQLAYLDALHEAYAQTTDDGRRALTDQEALQAAQAARSAKGQEIAIEERRREEGVEREVASMLEKNDKGFKDSLAGRLAAVDAAYSVIIPKLQDLERRGDTHIDGKPIAEVRAQIAAQKELADQLATMSFYEDNLKELETERSNAYKEINDNIEKGNTTALNGYNEALAVNARLAPQIEKLAAGAVKFGEALSKAHPGPQVENFIANAQKSLRSSTPGTKESVGAGQDENQAAASASLKTANTIIQERIELEKELQELVTKRILTQSEADQRLKVDYASTATELTAAVKSAAELIAVLQKTGDSPALQKLDAQLLKIQADAKFVSKSTEELDKAIANAFSSGAQTAFEGFEKTLGRLVTGTINLKTALADAGRGVLQFAGQFVEAIAQIIVKKEAQIAVDYILRSLGDFGGDDGVASAFASHDGSIVGERNSPVSRAVNPAWFTNAPRYHNGTVVGLAPDEQAAILKNGEEVLTRQDPRNALNGGKRGDSTPALNVRHVLVMDPDVIPQAMRGTRGEQVTLQHLKANVPTLRALLNVGTRRN